MNPLNFPLLADENIHPEVVKELRDQGMDVESVAEAGLLGQGDLTILRYAQRVGRVVLTHDSDFGRLVLVQKEPVIGIVYLRPGHIRSEFAIQMINSLAKQVMNVRPPFIVVVERRGTTISFRSRLL